MERRLVAAFFYLYTFENKVMINITLPDGSVRQVNEGTTALDVATSISEGLARNVLAAEVNGEVRDLTRPINEDATLKAVGLG